MKIVNEILLVLSVMTLLLSTLCNSNVTKSRRSIVCSNESNSSADEYKYLYNYLTGTGAHNFSESVTIGFLGAYGQTQVVLGALPLAIDAVNQNSELLPGRKLSYVAADIGTNPAASGLARRKSSLAARAIRVMTEMRDNGTIAFIGPDDTCSSEALVAAAWNLPMIAYKCSDTKVSDKRVFYTFARTLPPSSKVSKSVVALLIAFNWYRFVVVSGSHPVSGSEVQEAIKELSEAHGLIVTDTKQYSDYIPKNIDQMDEIVQDTYMRTRVYVFVGEHIALVDFVKCMQRRKLLDSGDYVIISVDDEIYDPNRRIKIMQRDYLDPFLNETWGNVSDIMGFRSVLKLTPSHPRNPHYKVICEKIKASSAKPPFCVPYHRKIFDSISVPIQAAYLYDAVMIYARALTEVFQNNEDPRNGTAILQRIVNRSYHSIQGYDVFIDAHGDAEGNFTVVALLDDLEMNGTLRMSMQPVGYFQYNSNSNLPYSLPEFKYLDLDRPIQWISGKFPRAEPVCGFEGERCIYKIDWRLVASVVLVTIIMMVAGLFAVKHYRYEQKLACLLWKIDMKDVTVIPTETTETTTETKNMIQVCRPSVFQAPTGSIAEISETNPKRAYTKIGLYKGNIVAIKQLHKRSVDLTRSIRKELKQIREVRHENIIPFIGASVDHGNVAILTAYCARGSLEDVLANEDLHLDNMFVSSLVTDILKGMIYLHDSDIISHGNLRSSNCVIDSRWVLQITDFGLCEFKADDDDPNYENKKLRRSLWYAPELLRDPSPPLRGTQKGDIYSFGILLYEIIGRSGPWGEIDMIPADIVKEVKKQGPVPFRPSLEALGAADYITKCIMACWHEEPEQRPDIRYVRIKLKEMQAGLKPNIFDNMLAIMEKYAYNLEELVRERTNQLTEEKKKTDALLHRMLPKSVADSLKKGERVEAESFDCVTIYFSDIVGFTELSAVSTPLQVIDLLNDLYTCFDSIISHYDVYKVETIGDAYMVVSGLPIRNGDRHAGEIASMALHLLTKIKKFEIKHRTGEQLQLRIGIHSGHCVAGVVGLKMPRYCLFGDTVNTASRMESSGESLRIHISQATYMLLQRLGGYRFEERGLIPIKGKGNMWTYWLSGEDPVQRLARIRQEMLGSSLFSSISSDHLSDTPDLLRRPGNYLHKPCFIESAGYEQTSCPLLQLHQRARIACSTLHLSQWHDIDNLIYPSKSNANFAAVQWKSYNQKRTPRMKRKYELYDSSYDLRRKRARYSTERRDSQGNNLSPYVTKRRYRKRSSIMTFPDEVLQKIFSYITYKELGYTVRLVCKRFRALCENSLNTSFKNIEKQLVRINTTVNNSLNKSDDDMETRCMCKLLNTVEYLTFHYSIIQSTIWRYTCGEFDMHDYCMYAGSILDLFYLFFELYTHEPQKIYVPGVINDYSHPKVAIQIGQLAKMYVLYFDRESEQEYNDTPFYSGSKIIDILNCATEAKMEVQEEFIMNDILTYKVSCYFTNSWLVGLEIKEEMARSWNEQMRLMYMRLRRIVISHTEMQMEYAQYRREVNMRPNLRISPKKPVNSVYTGYGEVGNVFYYYGAMNEGAYINKFDSFAMDLQLFDDNLDEDALSRVDIPFVGLWIVIDLTCPLYLAPMAILRKMRKPDKLSLTRTQSVNPEDSDEEETFDMKVTFHYPGAFYPRLPTNNVVHIVGKRR